MRKVFLALFLILLIVSISGCVRRLAIEACQSACSEAFEKCNDRCGEGLLSSVCKEGCTSAYNECLEEC